MKNYLYLLLLSVFASYNVVAQQTKIENTPESASKNTKTSQQGLLAGLDSRTTEIHESYYLDPSWSVATVRFYPRTIATSKGPIKLDSLSGIKMRVALQGNDVEFNTEEGVKVLSGTLVRTFSIENDKPRPRNFISTIEFNDESEQVKKGFFEVLADGEIKLLEYSKLKLEQPTYSASLNLGSKDAKVSLEKLLFTANDKEILRFTGKKDLYELMADKKTQIEKFIKDNNLSLKNKENLAKIFDYYNRIKKEG